MFQEKHKTAVDLDTAAAEATFSRCDCCHTASANPAAADFCARLQCAARFALQPGAAEGGLAAELWCVTSELL